MSDFDDDFQNRWTRAGCPVWHEDGSVSWHVTGTFKPPEGYVIERQDGPVAYARAALNEGEG